MNIARIAVTTLVVLFQSVTMIAQERPYHLKTNVLHLLITAPQLCLEYQFLPRQSISGSAFKGEFVFFNPVRIQGAAISYTKYFNLRSEDLRGFYLSPGLTYLGIEENGVFDPNFGVHTDLGGQHIFSSNIILGFGAGINWLYYGEKAFVFRPLLRAHINVGYRF